MFQVLSNKTEIAAVILSKSNCARSSVETLREWYLVLPVENKYSILYYDVIVRLLLCWSSRYSL